MSILRLFTYFMKPYQLIKIHLIIESWSVIGGDKNYISSSLICLLLPGMRMNLKFKKDELI